MHIVAVVLSYNGREDTLACLESLRGIETVVVDNGSSDGSADAVAAGFPDVDLIRAEVNLGFAAGNNVGIRRALDRGANWVLLLNNDATAEPGLLEALAGAAASRPDAGVFACKVLFADSDRVWYAGAAFDPYLGRSRHEGFGEPEPGSTDLRGRRVRLDSPGRYPSGFRPLRGLHPDGALRAGAGTPGPRPGRPAPVPSWRPSRTRRDHRSRWIQAEAAGGLRDTARATGAAMAVSRAAVERAGLLDEELFLYVEDLDWCLRIRSAGFAVVYVPDARARHRVSAASGGAGSPTTSYYETRNMLAVVERHRPLPRGAKGLRRALVVAPRILQNLRRPQSASAAVRGWRDYRRGRMGKR